MRTLLNDLINLFYPDTCYACNMALIENEKDICTDCRHELPVTNFHNEEDNPVTKVFYGRIEIEYATALFWFHKKGLVQQLLHNLKYRGREEIGVVLGKWMGHYLKLSPYFKDIDYVIPVPLHKKRQKRRGYNQVDKFAREIAKALNTRYSPDFLIKKAATKTQVFKSRLARWNTAKTIFKGKDLEVLNNKNILLVDDLITTGSTMENCANALRGSNNQVNLKISIATMAIA